MKKITFSFVTLVLTASVSTASLADDLLSVYNLSLQHDSQFRAAQAEHRALLELKSQSIAGLLPNISISALQSEHNDITNTSSNVESTYDYKTTSYNLNLVQPLYRHSNFVALDKADAQVGQASANFEYAKQDLILRVATQYFAVLAAMDDLAFARAERKAIKQQLIQTQQRFNVGLTAITDVHEARARHDQAISRAIVAKNTLSIAHETLREITATTHHNLAALSTKHPLVKPKPANIKQWVKTASIQNTLLTITKKNVDIALAEVAQQRAGHYPTLDFIAQKSYTDYSEGGLTAARERNDTTLSLQLNIPLYQGGIVNSRTRAASFRLTQAREKLEQQRRATERQTRNAYLGVIANISQVKALKQALASSEIALEATQAGLEVGTRTTVDVLNSQQELFRAKRDYAKVRYNYVLETFKLKAAAGTLSKRDISQLNPWLK